MRITAFLPLLSLPFLALSNPIATETTPDIPPKEPTLLPTPPTDGEVLIKCWDKCVAYQKAVTLCPNTQPGLCHCYNGIYRTCGKKCKVSPLQLWCPPDRAVYEA